MRPAPYCTPRMLAMLKRYVEGTERGDACDATPEGKARSQLMARGWIKNGMPTEAGRKYVEGK